MGAVLEWYKASTGRTGEHTVRTYSGISLERVAALSDGVFAVAMTLLVLDLGAPAIEDVHSDADLWAALVKIAPSAVAYVMSFLTLGIFWVGQQAQLDLFQRSDRNLTWLNFGFLFLVSLMPFSTKLLAAYHTDEYHIALILYWLQTSCCWARCFI